MIADRELSSIRRCLRKIRDSVSENKNAFHLKVTNDFLTTKLGLKSSSYRAMIPLLKRIGLIDDANVPNENYRQFRDENNSGAIMARQIKIAYKDLFAANEYANELKREDVISKLTTILELPQMTRRLQK